MDIARAKCWVFLLQCGLVISSVATAADDAGAVAAQVVSEFKALRDAGKKDQGEKKLRDAINRYADRLTQQSDDAQAHFALAQLQVHLDQVEAAKLHLERAMQLEPNNAAMYAFKGRAHGVAKEFPEAIKSLRRSLELDPKNTEARLMLAMSLANQNETAEALSQTREALKSTPDDPAAKTFLAAMLLVNRQNEEWERTAQSLINAHPRNKEHRLFLMTGFLAQQQFEKAYHACLELQKVDSDNTELEERLVVIATKARQPALAAMHIERLRELHRAGRVMKKAFSRDYFYQGQKRVVVEEQFELAPTAGTKFDFHVLNDNDEEELKVSLLYSTGMNAYLFREGKIKEHDQAFALTRLQNGKAKIFAVFTTVPTYEEVRTMAIEVMEGTRPAVITADLKNGDQKR